MKKGIDVSSYQKSGIDYNKIKKDGVEFAIIKIIRKDLEKDNGFEQHYNGFNSVKIPIVGVYNYSYADTADKFKTDAEAVVRALNGRKIKVWLDIEDDSQKGIGDVLINGINAYFNVLKDYGLEYGIYTGLNFYNTYLKIYEPILTCDMWIARYYNGYNKMKLSDVADKSKKPQIKNLVGWQYSSSGVIDGISGNVDLNELYIIDDKEDIKVSENYASKVINIALAEDGYLEKKNGNLTYLYDKKANSGSANYTKYNYEMHQIYPSVMDYPCSWCDSYIDWCFYKAYGITNAKGLIGGNFNDYTVASAQLYKNKNAYYKSNPKVGDQIFFKNSTRICHTGLVYKVDKSRVYTIEGNTSSTAGVIANGGCVRKKDYLLTYSKIDGYGRPKYDAEPVASGYTYNGLDYSLVFNPTFYSNAWGDLKVAFGIDSVKLFSHFISDGMREGRQAISTFNVRIYQANYVDLRNAFGADLVKYYQHYITDGHFEGRIAI